MKNIEKSHGKEMNGYFSECMNERDCKRHNIPITRETTRDFTKDLEEFAELLSKLSTQKASVVMCMEKQFTARKLYRRK